MDTTKVKTLAEVVAAIPAGPCTVALGGNSLHRVPHAAVRALAQRSDLALHIVKTAGAWDIDLLCLAGNVAAVSAGFVGYESEFGLARHYRRAVESGTVAAQEHACYTVIGSLRAAAYGLGFMPVRAMEGSDLPDARGFAWIDDPYGTAPPVVAIPAIVPDVAFIHVQYADERGNGVIMGPKNEDLIMARAAAHVVLTAEEIVPTDQLPVPLDHIDIPSVLVGAVVESPRGAWPGSCYGRYDVDAAGVRALQELTDSTALQAWLTSLEAADAEAIHD
jgi:glutaconate CoA-transferase subunit A